MTEPVNSNGAPIREARMNSIRRRKRRAARFEKAREVAFRAMLDGMHFHEVAISDVFEAERQYIALAEQMIELLGAPKGVRSYVV